MTQLTKTITVRGAFDKRHPDPHQNYGIHGMELMFRLQGPRGVVQFLVYTGMHLRHVEEELWERNQGGRYNPFSPDGADIGYHSPVPTYEGQTARECDLLPEGKCYYDGTSLGASEFMPTFLEGGDEAVWKMLEERYEDLPS